MKREPAHVATIARLEAEGWTFDHEATYSTYRYAGTVSPMRSRNGVHYCRVHTGKSVSRHAYQITYVMRKEG